MSPSVWIAFLAAAVPAASQEARAARLGADAGSGSVVVHAAKTGLLSTLGHDHRLVVGRWHAEITYADRGSGALEALIIVDASSLRETAPRLGDAARAIVEREVAGADVLDAKEHPEIRFQGTAVVASPSASLEEGAGLLRGQLTLHGSTRSVVIPFRIEARDGGYHARGGFQVRQTEFGMKPYSTAMGTIGVDDELRVEFDFVACPAEEPRSSPGAVSARPGT